jgi:hypothetical protein
LSFPGLVGYFHLWIPNFGLLVKPLYTASQGALEEPLSQTQTIHQIQGSFNKGSSTWTPRPFLTFLPIPTHKPKHRFGPSVSGLWPHTLTCHISKQLDSTTQEWPPCLKALGAAALLTSEAQKFTLNHYKTILSTYNLQELISHQTLLTLPPTQIQQLHALFASNPLISFQ